MRNVSSIRVWTIFDFCFFLSWHLTANNVWAGELLVLQLTCDKMAIQKKFFFSIFDALYSNNDFDEPIHMIDPLEIQIAKSLIVIWTVEQRNKIASSLCQVIWRKRNKIDENGRICFRNSMINKLRKPEIYPFDIIISLCSYKCDVMVDHTRRCHGTIPGNTVATATSGHRLYCGEHSIRNRESFPLQLY